MATHSSKDQVVSDLSQLVEFSVQNGVSLDDILIFLSSESQLEFNPFTARSNWKCSIWSLIRFVVFRLLPILFLGCLLYSPLSKLAHMSPCVVHAPPLFAEIMHPIFNCTICEGLTEAPRLVNLSKHDFMKHHAYSSKPIVAVGAALHWPAIDIFSYDYFKDLYLSHPEGVETDMKTGQFFSYSSNIRNLKELFELSSESAAMQTERWYIGWSTSDPDVGREIRSHTSIPDFIPPDETSMHLAWIFMGAPGPGASMHIDSVGVPSWQAQISGTKTWTLAPPVECEHVCASFNVTVHRGDITNVILLCKAKTTRVLPQYTLDNNTNAIAHALSSLFFVTTLLKEGHLVAVDSMVVISLLWVEQKQEQDVEGNEEDGGEVVRGRNENNNEIIVIHK